MANPYPTIDFAGVSRKLTISPDQYHSAVRSEAYKLYLNRRLRRALADWQAAQENFVLDGSFKLNAGVIEHHEISALAYTIYEYRIQFRMNQDWCDAEKLMAEEYIVVEYDPNTLLTFQLRVA